MSHSDPVAGAWQNKPVIDVALATLEDRFKEVRKRFSQAARHGGKDPERIHKLRVATRRASAALHLYDVFVPRKSATKMAKRLKRVRRAAGKVRDYDLLLSRFSSDAPQAESPSFLKGMHSSRTTAYRDLCRLQQTHRHSGRLKRRTRELLGRTRRKSARRPHLAAQKFAEWAPERLRIFVSDFFQAASPRLRDLSQLHQFRIRSKALRYAMELVSPSFPAEFKAELYPVIERLQTLLGNINDEANFLRSIGKRLARGARESEVDGLRHRMAQEQHALDELEREFAEWWTNDRREALQRRFDQLMSTRRS